MRPPLSGRDRLDFAVALKAIDDERDEPGDDDEEANDHLAENAEIVV